MNKIALIIPYFGKFPEWMPLYLYSCSKQRNIDFLYFTDCEIPKKIYENTIFIETTFEEYCKKVSQHLHIDFHPAQSYKLCDLKPFYGIVHEDELKDYEWWGFGDLDLIYGDLSLLLSEDNLRRYDLLTTHIDKVAGHFTVVRKDSDFTRIPFDIPNWKVKLMLEKHVFLDETEFAELVKPWKVKKMNRIDFHFLSKHTNPDKKFWYYYWIDKLMPFGGGKALMKEFFTTFKPRVGTSISYDLKTGQIDVPLSQEEKIVSGAARLYLHFLYFKKTKYWAENTHYWQQGFYQIPDGYDFSNGGIVEITTECIRLVSPPPNTHSHSPLRIH